MMLGVRKLGDKHELYLGLTDKEFSDFRGRSGHPDNFKVRVSGSAHAGIKIVFDMRGRKVQRTPHNVSSCDFFFMWPLDGLNIKSEPARLSFQKVQQIGVHKIVTCPLSESLWLFHPDKEEKKEEVQQVVPQQKRMDLGEAILLVNDILGETPNTRLVLDDDNNLGFQTMFPRKGKRHA